MPILVFHVCLADGKRKRKTTKTLYRYFRSRAFLCLWNISIFWDASQFLTHKDTKNLDLTHMTHFTDLSKPNNLRVSIFITRVVSTSFQIFNTYRSITPTKHAFKILKLQWLKKIFQTLSYLFIISVKFSVNWSRTSSLSLYVNIRASTSLSISSRYMLNIFFQLW